MRHRRRPQYDLSLSLSLCPVPLRSAARARLPLTLLAGTLLAFAAHAAPAMTLEERIACREKIEDVYWAHRIWPRENQGQKPAREAVAPHAAIVARVEESLRYETALGELWQEALSPQAIQDEMDRQARATRDPAMLRELWAALDDDPARVAECLVRPELAERRIKERYANDPTRHEAARQRAALEIEASTTLDDLAAGGGQLLEVEWRRTPAGKAGFPQPGVVEMDPEQWRRALTALGTPPGSARAQVRGPGTPRESSAGGELSGLPLDRVSALREDRERFFVQSVRQVSPGRVRVATVSWAKVPFEEWWSTQRQTTSPAFPPAASYVLQTVAAGGCLYDSWKTSPGLSSTTPRARELHTAVWTGTEMIVWGGFDLWAATSFNTGGRYTPATDTWVATSTVGAPSDRRNHTAVWTGSQMIVWGGFGSFGFLDTGGRYAPASDTWLPTSTVSAPAGRDSHTAVWTGSAMIVWGGEPGGGTVAIDTGGRYDPVSDSWVPTATTGAPAPRLEHTAVWTGREMIVWGGYSGVFADFGDGGRYDPSTDTWTATSGASAPSPRVLHSAVWTGTQMLIWGGRDTYTIFNTGGRYSPANDSWTATSTVSAPAVGGDRTAVWTGAELIVWGGYGPQGYLASGGRYSPASDHWVATNVAGAPTPRAEHSAVWTGTEMIVWAGSVVNGLTNSGGRYTPATDSWVATGIQGALSERAHHTSVWTGSEMIVWGGADGLGSFASGGRYVPATDSWVPTSMTKAPAPRTLHTAIWTGTEMVVWGGSNGSGDLNTGGRYVPATDAWLATDPGGGAPIAREQHTAVWTGTEMIVWGGSSFGLPLQSGGRYDPGIDVWRTTAIATFPSARYAHTAVWTGSEMIVWGGWDGTNYDNAGGRYTPATDSWARMASVPAGRQGHTAVWTGREMIVWGGMLAQTLYNSGDRYTPANDGWLAMTLSGAPDGRFGHSAVWTGSEMVVWGGTAATRALASGGRYQPSVDRWVATDVLRAPEARSAHSAVWTGSAMLVWGGASTGYLASSGYLDDGAAYCPLPSPSSFFTVAPCRLFDSRTGPWLSSGAERTIAAAGSCGIPAGASAAAVNLTAVGASGAGSLGAYPTPGQPTGLGIVDFQAGKTRANNAIVLLSSSGTLTLQALVGQSGVTDAVVDVVGYFQ
jgi:N-acetylneuraminic acid mutarotase